MFLLFFFNDTPSTEIYTLSLHDALPIYASDPLNALSWNLSQLRRMVGPEVTISGGPVKLRLPPGTFVDILADRKSTRLNSSHSQISYAVFCLKKKKNAVYIPLLRYLYVH